MEVYFIAASAGNQSPAFLFQVVEDCVEGLAFLLLGLRSLDHDEVLGVDGNGGVRHFLSRLKKLLKIINEEKGK